MRHLLFAAVFIALGSIASFAQSNDGTSCPVDTKEVTIEVSADLGIVEGSYKETSCEPKDTAPSEPKDTAPSEPKDTAPSEPRGNADRPRD